eukprot:TRINITY_DN25296_c0_g2_i2.p1 TRINITY_DN25296_c0_g2~~TRINITY_DN25296_c0_g2_i2.p1  ORF type:complete len:150 (+),score=43.93 TRINITY_DN25296_c0_g2_i2:230-679(+)
MLRAFYLLQLAACTTATQGVMGNELSALDEGSRVVVESDVKKLKSRIEVNGELEWEVTTALSLSYTPAQTILRWALQKGIRVIPKSVTPSRISENLQALTLPNLTAAHMQTIDAVRTTPPTRYCMAAHYMKPGTTPLQFWGDDGGDPLP